MARETTNYGLIKPTPEEFYDVEVSNDNMDKIDAAIALAAESGGSSEETLAKLDEIIAALGNLKFESSYENIYSGSFGDFKVTNPGQPATYEIEFNYREIDFIVNDSDENASLTFFKYGQRYEDTGNQRFILKPGESINDVSFSGVKIECSEPDVRFMLLG